MKRSTMGLLMVSIMVIGAAVVTASQTTPTFTKAEVAKLEIQAGKKAAAKKINAGSTKLESKQLSDREKLIQLARADHLSRLFREVTRQTKPAVVEVRVTKEVMIDPKLEALKKRFGGKLPPNIRIVPKSSTTPKKDDKSKGKDDKKSSKTPPKPQPYKPQLQKRTVRGLGSGVIVDAKKGYILTNAHVVRDAKGVQVLLSDKRLFDADWVRSDPATDLAVIKIRPDGLQEAPLGDSDKMQVGDWVLAFGSPRGLTETITAGIISATGRRTRKPGMYADYFQTDAAINKGNSGGPLVNMYGEVIGINNAIVTFSGGNEGIGFSIPANMIKKIMAQLITHGRVIRGFFGLRTQELDSGLMKSFKLPNMDGALVVDVTRGAPAQKAGLKPGDCIVKIGKDEVENTNDVHNLASLFKPGEIAPVEVIRDGKRLTLKVKVGSRKGSLSTVHPQTPPVDPHRYGFAFAATNSTLLKKYRYRSSVRGMMITEVDPRSDAAKRGFKPGLIIVSVDGKAVTSTTMFAKYLAEKSKADGVRLRVVDPQGGIRFVYIQPWGK